MNDTEATMLALSVEIIARLTSYVGFVVNELNEDYQKAELTKLVELNNRIKEVVN